VLYEDNFNYLSKMCLLRMRDAALRMIAAARDRRIPIVVSGSDATDHPALYLEHGAAAVIAGEGEVTLVHVLRALRDGSPGLDAIDGTVVLRNGIVTRSAARPIVRDLDRLPRPAWDLVDVERYRAVWMARHGHFSMNIATTRGCPYHCNWCAKPIYGQRYTARSPEHVADEIAWLAETYRPDHLWVTDDIFGLKPGWVEHLASALRARGTHVPFKCLMRADGVTDAVVAALREAGCRTVWIGAESGSQRILDAMEKGTRVEQIEKATTLLQQADIEVGFFLQFGYPGETLDDIALTIDMMRRCRPDDIGISVSYPLPGTRFHDRVRAELGAKQNWVDSSDLAMMYRAAYSPDFYRALHQYVHARFRSQRAVDALGAIIRRPQRPRADGRALLRTVTHGALAAARLPWLGHRVRRMAAGRVSTTCAVPAVPLPLLTRQAAAMPSEQRH
jgi:anaerobic magnesium-protoporphyrin IX monomethyl ester cyclase